MKPDDAAALVDVLNAARLIVAFRAGLEEAAFLSDAKTQSAVLHQLLVLGEAAKRLSQGFRSGHPEIPWKNIAGMRDRLIHRYDDVDLQQVWRTVTLDIPSLIEAIVPLAPPEEHRL